MERDQLDKMLDEWLDRASLEFGRAEIHPGFEKRIIAGLHDRMTRRSLWFRWQILTAAAAVVVVFLFCLFFARFTDHAGEQVASNRVEESKVALQQNDSGTSKLGRDLMKPHRARRSEVVIAKHARESLPRQNIFPSTPLSSQEHLLLSYVRAVSSGRINGFMDDSEYHPIEITKVEIPKTEISKLEIEPISIEPLP